MNELIRATMRNVMAPTLRFTLWAARPLRLLASVVERFGSWRWAVALANRHAAIRDWAQREMRRVEQDAV